MNGRFWDDLRPDEKALPIDAARAAITANRGLNPIIEASDRGLPALKQRMEVYIPTAAELMAFRQASEPTVKAYIQNSFRAEGSELLDALSAGIEAANN
jgi:hypothetical protein